ncbi:hypothetical protein [Streptomyces atroolivaceus]|uniref:Uncharacterized protein n=1 Tax=Streptomyces atroolivaceus TaxID=66869 RepID=A0ABV9VL24_STRAZ|nr:hypothetical protein [Streptomyces atroolivaceus]
MATWKQFIDGLTQGLGAENVKGGAKDLKVVATVDVPATAKDGSKKTRRQKVHFEYDGENTHWIAATSFIGPMTEPKDATTFLEFLGDDVANPGGVIVDGQAGVRSHFSLDEFDNDVVDDTDKKLLEIACMTALIIGRGADKLEELVTGEDVQ